MSTDRPVWLRNDGTDERLVNPIADLVIHFSHNINDGYHPRADKAITIEQSHPEFAQSLLALSSELNSLGVLRKIVTGETPTEDEIKRHEQLIRERLQLTQQFAETNYGSIEDFMRWFTG